MAKLRNSGRSFRRHASAIDRHVGGRIRERRRAMAVSREQLAGALGISAEQVRRYEAGLAIIVASRLHAIGMALAVNAGVFFEGAPADTEAPTDDTDGGRSFPTARELRRVIDAYWRVADPELRREFRSLIAAIGESTTDDGRSPTTGT